MLVEHALQYAQRLRADPATRINTMLSATAALAGITGTALLGMHPQQVLPVFCLYLLSSSCWIAVGARTQQPWLLCSSAVHCLLALKGLFF